MGASFRSGRGVLVGVALAGASSIAAALIAAACIPELQVTELPPPPPPPTCGNGFVDLDAGEQCDPGEAGAIGCTAACRIDCGDGGLLDDASGHCYFTLNASSSDYNGASSVCDLATSHLVTFVSRDELSTVAAWNTSHTGAAVWVGLRNEPNTGWVPVAEVDEPGWTGGCPGCFAAYDDAGAFPQPSDAGAQCLEMVPGAASGTWLRVPCAGNANLHRTVCEREPPGILSQPCNGGICIDLRRTFGHKRYIYIETKSSPDDANAFCRQFPSGHLVMPDSREEREELWAELSKIDDNLKQVWIGLARTDAEAGPVEWRWDDDALLDAGRPVPWGVQASSIDAGSPRAYLERLGGAGGVVDSQLARNVVAIGAALPTALPFVCQFVDVPDGAAE